MFINKNHYISLIFLCCKNLLRVTFCYSSKKKLLLFLQYVIYTYYFKYFKLCFSEIKHYIYNLKNKKFSLKTLGTKRKYPRFLLLQFKVKASQKQHVVTGLNNSSWQPRPKAKLQVWIIRFSLTLGCKKFLRFRLPQSAPSVEQRKSWIFFPIFQYLAQN